MTDSQILFQVSTETVPVLSQLQQQWQLATPVERDEHSELQSARASFLCHGGGDSSKSEQ
jgi:hypothetical protein